MGFFVCNPVFPTTQKVLEKNYDQKTINRLNELKQKLVGLMGASLTPRQIGNYEFEKESDKTPSRDSLVMDLGVFVHNSEQVGLFINYYIHSKGIEEGITREELIKVLDNEDLVLEKVRKAIEKSQKITAQELPPKKKKGWFW